MTQSFSELATTAKQLANWLGIWRILTIIFGLLGIIGGLVGFFLMNAAFSEMGMGGGGLLLLAPLLILVGTALSVWIYSMLLGWAKDWVEQAAVSAEQGNAPHGLAETRGNLDKWLSFIIWGTLAFIVLGFLVLMGVMSAIGSIAGEGAIGGVLGAGAFILLPILAVVFLLFTYLPLTALRRFLGEATGRLQGSSQIVMPAAKAVSTWTWVLIALQAANVLFSLPSLFGGDDSVGPVMGLFGLLVALAIAALYIVPLLLTGKFAKLLADRLDTGAGQVATPPTSASAAAPLRDYSSMGRMADQLDEPRH